MQFFQEAVEADPDFAPGLAGLAGARFIVTMDDPDMPESELERAQDEARRALAMDTASMEAKEVFRVIEENIAGVMPSHAVTPSHEVGATPRTRVVSPALASNVRRTVLRSWPRDTQSVNRSAGTGNNASPQDRCIDRMSCCRQRCRLDRKCSARMSFGARLGPNRSGVSAGGT